MHKDAKSRSKVILIYNGYNYIHYLEESQDILIELINNFISLIIKGQIQKSIYFYMTIYYKK